MSRSQGPLDACKGFLALPMAFVLLLLAGAGVGLLGLLGQWDRRVRIQLELDACVRSLALSLRDTQRRIESLNSRITLSRAASAAALMAGNVAAAATSQKVIDALVLLQEAELLRWSGRQALQLASRRCPLDPGHAAEFAGPLPWHRLPADPVGKAGLQWRPKYSRRQDIQVHLIRKGLRTHASVRLSSKGEWIASHRLPDFGAGPH